MAIGVGQIVAAVMSILIDPSLLPNKLRLVKMGGNLLANILYTKSLPEVFKKSVIFLLVFSYQLYSNWPLVGNEGMNPQ